MEGGRGVEFIPDLDLSARVAIATYAQPYLTFILQYSARGTGEFYNGLVEDLGRVGDAHG